MPNYIPEFQGYSGQGAFRYWCQKVLPLVYDDSLSYYELLNKVVVYLNNTIKDVAKAEGNIDSLLTAYTQLQNYVNDYFDNLDVQEEINTKLDEMAENGELSDLLEPFIPDLVTAWLTENVIIPEGGAVTLDPTLTSAVQAAPAKTVGDNFVKTIKYRGVLNPNATPPITPDTVTDIGYWTCSSSNTQTFIGIASSTVFFNLKQGANDFIQMFITFRGEIYGRYNKTGDFLSFSDFTRGDLSNPNTTTAPGFYRSLSTVTQQYTGENTPASFLNMTTDAGVVFIQAFILPNGKVYSRYGNTGNFVTLKVPKKQTVFDPQNEVIISSSGGFLSVTIPAGFYAVPEYSLGVSRLDEDIIITQTDTTVYQYGVFNLTSKTGRLAGRLDNLASDDLVLFTFYRADVDNISVSHQKFPRGTSENTGTKTMNDFFAPMFNRVGTPFKIVLGGDSITHGNGGTGYAQDGDTIIGNYKRNPNGYCWANLFKSYIEGNYNATVVNNGVTGTNSWWWDGYKSTLIPSDTDLFILTLGTNNRIKIANRTGTTHDEQISNYYTQMKSIIEYCNTIGVPILLCSSIPATATNENLMEDNIPVYPSHVYEFNGVLQKLASEYNMEYFNLYDAAYYYVKDHNLSLNTLLPDGLHPGDEMYRIMFYLYLRGFNLAPSYVDVELPE